MKSLLQYSALALALCGCQTSTAPIAETEAMTNSQMPASDSSAEAQVDEDAVPADATLDQPDAEEPNEAKVVRSAAEWRAMLSSQEYHVLREKGTEAPFTNEYDEHFEPGSYACAGCGVVLFESDTKFNSGCGWPAFYAAKAGDRVVLSEDLSHGMVRTEVTCARCDSHLGHVFEDAPQTPTGQRYCINSVSLKFIPTEDAASDERNR